MTEETVKNIVPAAEAQEREPINLSWSDYKWPAMFLLSMSMVGLWFPLGFLFVPIIFINRFKYDRYDFVIMSTIFLCGSGLIAEGSLPVKTGDIALLLSIILVMVHRNRGIVSKTVKAWLGYCIAIFAIAMVSEETMLIQIRTMRYLFLFISFIIPISCFSGEEFDIRLFFRRLIPYVIILWIYYILDAYVIQGYIFLPRTPHAGRIPDSTFYYPWIFNHFIRKYPQGLILTALAVYPICKFYKLKLIHWVLFIGACAACQTFTVISGFAIGALVCVAKLRTIFKYILLIPVIFTAVYFIDAALPEVKKDNRNESALRVKSSIDQVLDLMEAQDDEDLANFASGRMAQFLPKLELVNMLDREWTGLGYLHPELTTNPKYIIDNEYYINTEESEEVATQLIETEVLQVYITSGWIGIILYFTFFIMTYRFVRKLEYSRFYLSVLIMTFWFGMGSYGGWTAVDGQILLATAYGATILAGGSKDEPDEAKKTKGIISQSNA